jgi:DNA-binding response OmpR family regulator
MKGRQLLVYAESWSDVVVIEDELVSSGIGSRFRRVEDRQQLELFLDETWDALLLSVRIPDRQFSEWLARIRQRRSS